MVRDVAEYLIYLSNVEGENGITNLKLQKLLYYAQGFHLALRGEVLFDDALEAWAHGPVVRSVYDRYKGFGYNAIDGSNESFGDSLTDVQRDLIRGVWMIFSSYTASQLEGLIHSEDPWKSAREGLGTYGAGDRAIDVEVLRDFIRVEYTFD